MFVNLTFAGTNRRKKPIEKPKPLVPIDSASKGKPIEVNARKDAQERKSNYNFQSFIPFF